MDDFMNELNAVLGDKPSTPLSVVMDGNESVSVSRVYAHMSCLACSELD